MRIRRNVRRLALIGALVLAIATALMFFPSPTAPGKPKIKGHEGFVIVHATNSTAGCMGCHDEPMNVECTFCHTPPTIIDGKIYFPHHDISPGGPPDDCQSSRCHDGVRGDARYVRIIQASHKYCEQCHRRTHSPPP